MNLCAGGRVHSNQLPEIAVSNPYVKSYVTFIAFLAVTKIVVAPIVQNLNVPLLKDVL